MLDDPNLAFLLVYLNLYPPFPGSYCTIGMVPFECSGRFITITLIAKSKFSPFLSLKSPELRISYGSPQTSHGHLVSQFSHSP